MKPLIISVYGLLAGVSLAQQFINVGSNADLWDVFRGTAVTATSGGALFFAPENAFGARVPTVPGNPLYDFIFQDGMPVGFVHFIEWKTALPITLRSFRLHAEGDGEMFDYGREFGRFVLKSKTLGSQTFDKVLYEFTPTHPYEWLDRVQRIIIATNVDPTVAQEFRAEFTDRGNRFWSGPRIIELDGFEENLALAIYPAIELVWPTEVGRKYQVQWTVNLLNPDWKNSGDFIVGDGSPKSFLDSTRASGRTVRYYRLKEVL